MRRTFLGIVAAGVVTTAQAGPEPPPTATGLALGSPAAGLTEVRDAAGERAGALPPPARCRRARRRPTRRRHCCRRHYAPGPDCSWGSSLLVAPAGGDGPSAATASTMPRADAAPDGRVAVERGRPGPAVPGRLRVDELTVDPVDPDSGPAERSTPARASRPTSAGVAGRELIVYLVQPGQASLRAVDLTAAPSASMSPTCRRSPATYRIDGDAVGSTTATTPAATDASSASICRAAPAPGCARGSALPPGSSATCSPPPPRPRPSYTSCRRPTPTTAASRPAPAPTPRPTPGRPIFEPSSHGPAAGATTGPPSRPWPRAGRADPPKTWPPSFPAS